MPTNPKKQKNKKKRRCIHEWRLVKTYPIKDHNDYVYETRAIFYCIHCLQLKEKVL